MALRMAQPWKDPATGVLHLRQRTPLDLVKTAHGRTVQLPIGEMTVRVKVGAIVQASLRTKDANEAKARHAIADAALRRYWSSLRKGETSLTHRQAVALAGKVYRGMTDLVDGKPNVSQHAIAEAEARQKWLDLIATHNLDPAQCEELLIQSADKDGQDLRALMPEAVRKYPKSVEDLYGPRADEILLDENLEVDPASRWMLIKELCRAHHLFLERVQQLAKGDYRPDDNLIRFPEFQRPSSTVPTSGKSIDQLFEEWAAKQKGIKSESTIDRYKPSLKSFAAFLRSRDIRQITPHDVYRWAEHRRDVEGVDGRARRRDTGSLGLRPGLADLAEEVGLPPPGQFGVAEKKGG